MHRGIEPTNSTQSMYIARSARASIDHRQQQNKQRSNTLNITLFVVCIHNATSKASYSALIYSQPAKGRTKKMPHFPSFFIGCLTSGTVFLAVHQQLSHRRRLSEKWALQGMYTASARHKMMDCLFCSSLNLSILFSFNRTGRGKISLCDCPSPLVAAGKCQPGKVDEA
jgi:hypothetical protein